MKQPLLSHFAPRTAAALHRSIQLIYLCFTAWVGWRFYCYAQWAMGQSESWVPKPPAVEGFLPISALLAAKRFLFTGEWDAIHPAGLVIFFFALLSALLLRKGFCGYICPVGALSTLLFRLGRHHGLTLRIPPRIMWLLSLPKYALLAFFLQFVLPMGLEDIEAFLHSPYNMVADTKMLLFFLPPNATVCVVVGLLVLGSIFVPSFWCRCLCPYGALLGLLSLASPLAVRRDAVSCLACGRCSKACPQGIVVEQKERVCSSECTGCQECVSVCPQKGCLSLQLGYTRGKSLRLPWFVAGCATVGILLALYACALATDHWVSELPQEMVRLLHMRIMSIGH